MELLTKEQILAAADRPFEDVSVPEWGGTVRVTVMPGVDRDRFDSELGRRRRKDGSFNVAGMSAYLCALACVDEQGKRLFTLEDVRALEEKSGVALNRVYEAAARLNGLLPDSLEGAKGN